MQPFSIERRYRDDSNVLDTVFITDGGSARVTESLNSGVSGRLPWWGLARRVEGLSGVSHTLLSPFYRAKGPAGVHRPQSVNKRVAVPSSERRRSRCAPQVGFLLDRGIHLAMSGIFGVEIRHQRWGPGQLPRALFRRVYRART